MWRERWCVSGREIVCVSWRMYVDGSERLGKCVSWKERDSGTERECGRESGSGIERVGEREREREFE